MAAEKVKANPNPANGERSAENAVDRLKNPVFIAAGGSFLYKLYNSYGVAKGLPPINLDEFKTAVDMTTWVILGYGVYSVFPKK
jgi:hypothetical protein